MLKGKKFFLGMAVLLMSASLFFAGCSTGDDAGSGGGGTISTLVPDNAVIVSNEATLRGLLGSSITEPIAYMGYSGSVPLAALEIPAGKTVYLAGNSVSLNAPLAVASGAKLVLLSNLTTTATNKLLVNGTVEVGLYSTLANAADATEVIGYTGTEAAGDLAATGNTVIGTSKVQVLAGGYLELHSGDVVAASPTANQFTLAQAWAAAGAGNLEIDGSTAFSVADLAGLATSSRSIMATTGEFATALPATIGKNAQITATGAVVSGSSLTVNGSLVANSADLTAVATINVGVGGALSATGSAASLAAGVAVEIDAGGSAALQSVALLKQSSVGAVGTFTAAVTAFDSNADLDVGAGATVNGITFPAAVDVVALPLNGAAIGDYTVPAGKALDVSNGKTLTLTAASATATLTLKGAAATGGAKITGQGKVVAGKTEIVGGTNGWQAVGTTGDVAIAALTADTASVTASAATVALTAQSGSTQPSITQLGGNGYDLSLGSNTTIDFGANGSLVLPQSGDANKATVTLPATALLKFGTGATIGDATAANLNTAFASHAVAATNITGHTTESSSTTGTLTQIIGASTLNTITGPDDDDGAATISAALVVANN